MSKVCAVSGCNSKYSPTAQFSLHSFPKNKTYYKKWVYLCQQDPLFELLKDKRMCSKHFKKEDFKDGIKASIMNIRPTRLKETAIPSLNLPDSVKPSPLQIKAERFKELSRRKKLINSLLGLDDSDLHVKKQAASVSDNLLLGSRSQAPVNESEIKFEEGEDRIKEVPGQMDQSFDEKIDRTVSSDKEERTSRYNKIEIEILEARLAKLRAENEALRNTIIQMEDVAEKHFEEIAIGSFKDLLTPNQIRVALGSKKIVKWTQQELSRAFTIFYLSKPCYNFLRDTLKYPLPGISTIQRWLQDESTSTSHLIDIKCEASESD